MQKTKITQQMVEKSYEIAIKVYRKQLDKNGGASLLNEQYGMNPASADMYIGNINRMVEGQVYKRLMASEHTRFFLTMIKNDFGMKVLEKALYAVKLHFQYLRSIKHSSTSIEELYDEFMKSHDFNRDAEIETEPIYAEDNEEEIALPYAMPQNFVYEKDLKNSLVGQAEELFPGYKIYGDCLEGVEYQIEGKRIDLLLENESENKLLAIELKANVADCKVYGQISMYLNLLEDQFPDKIVEGIIIAGKIDTTLKIAAGKSKAVKLQSYKVSLELVDE